MKLILHTPDVLRLYGATFLQVPHKDIFPKIEMPNIEEVSISEEAKEVEETKETEIEVKVLSEQPNVLPPKEETPPQAEIISETPKIEPPKTEEAQPPKVEVLLSPSYTASVYELGNPIAWKLGKKKNAKIVFIMDEGTFANTMMLNALRSMVIDEVKIPAEYVVFGTYANDSTQWELRDMPVNVGLLFTEPIQNQPNPYTFQDKKVFVMGDLKNVVLDTKRQEKLKTWLKKYFLAT